MSNQKTLGDLKVPERKKEIVELSSFMDTFDRQGGITQAYDAKYGNTGCGVFKWGVQNQKDFCLRINILKGNY